MAQSIRGPESLWLGEDVGKLPDLRADVVANKWGDVRGSNNERE